ncbi:hypothetical protein ACLKA6_009408 [Drosophila palustris]
MKLKRIRKLKLLLCIWWVISNCLVFDIGAHCHCLREMPEGSGATRHMWQTRYPTGPLADTGSCNRPTTLRLTTDCDEATSQLNGNGNAAAERAASPVVTLANYVYQCAAKRTESNPSNPSTISSSIDLTKTNKPLRHEQQMTVPDIVLQLAKSWQPD